jgi:hypothetical protein
MKRHTITYIIVLFAISCTKEKSTKNKQEYQAEFMQYFNEQYKAKDANEAHYDSFINSISDTVLRKKWDDQLSSNFSQIWQARKGINRISYILIMQADSIDSWKVDTLNPVNIINFNERNNTSNLLKNGLNKVILQCLREYDSLLADTMYGNPMSLSKTKNLRENELYWNSISKEIETLGEFQICKVKLYTQMEHSVSKRFQYYETLYRRNK